MDLKKILVPIDGTEHSNFVLEKGIDFAKAIGGELTTLYVQQANGDNRIQSHVLTNFVNARARDREIEIETRMIIGSPTKVIARESSKYDIIFMGTMGKTGVKKVLLGSVAQSVVKRASCPVITIKPIPWAELDDLPETWEFKRILLAVDGSKSNWPAIESAIRLANTFSVGLTAVYASCEDDDERAIDKYMNKVVKFGKEKGTNIEKRIIYGDPGWVIVEESSEFDIIVIGTRRTSAVTTAIFGSVAEDVMEEANRPVMVVRGD